MLIETAIISSPRGKAGTIKTLENAAHCATFARESRNQKPKWSVCLSEDDHLSIITVIIGRRTVSRPFCSGMMVRATSLKIGSLRFARVHVCVQDISRRERRACIAISPANAYSTYFTWDTCYYVQTGRVQKGLSELATAN